MELDEAAPCQVTHNEIFSPSSLAEGSMPAFLSQLSLPVLWVTQDEPPDLHLMTEIAHGVMKVYELAEDDLVDVSDVTSHSLEDIRRNSRRVTPDSKKDKAWVFYRRFSSGEDLITAAFMRGTITCFMSNANRNNSHPPQRKEYKTTKFSVDFDLRENFSHIISPRLIASGVIDVSSAAATESGKVLNSWNEWRGERRVVCQHFPFSGDKNPLDFSIYDLGGRVHLELALKLECTSTETQTTAKLTIKSMDLGMHTHCLNCTSRSESCQRTCGQFFVKEVRIIVRPDDWGQHGGDREPCATAKAIQEQYLSGRAVQVGVHPKSTTFTLQSSKAVTCQAPTFEWGSTTRSIQSPNTVKWTWELKKAANGDKIDYDTTLSSKLPLGFNPNEFIQYRDDVSASWDGPPQVDLQTLQRNWHMTVIVETAVVRGKNRLYGSHVKRGPTIAFSQDGLTFI